MAEEDYGVVPYKELSELKKDLEGIQTKKDVSNKDLHDVILKLADTMGSMIGIFAAAAEQMKLEEKEKESEMKKHEVFSSKMDKLLDQNKTIAEGMVAVVEMVKERLGSAKKKHSESNDDDEPSFAAPEPKFLKQDWKPSPRQMPPRAPPKQQPMPPMMPPPMAPPMPGPPQFKQDAFDSGMPPMEPGPMPDLDFPDDSSLEDLAEPKKKSIFGMFKKQ